MRRLLAPVAVLAIALPADAQMGGWGRTSDTTGRVGGPIGTSQTNGAATVDAGSADCGDPPSTSLAVRLSALSVDGADNGTLTDSDPVAAWVDLGSIGDDPAQATGSARPTFIADCINSQPCVRFDGGDRLLATTASNFTFMSNGSDWTMYIVARTTAANPDAFYILASTGSSTSVIGTRITYDDRVSVSRNDRVTMTIGNGSANAVTTLSADGAFAAATWQLLASKLDDDGAGGADAFQYVDGLLAASAASGNAYSASDGLPLTIGSYASAGTGFFVGDFAEILIYQAGHDDTVRGAVGDWVECEYGVTMLAAAEVTPPDDLVLFALAGQSNMSGRGEPVAYGPYSDIYTYGNDDVWHLAEDPIDNWIGQVDTVSADVGSARVGPGLSFAIEYQAANASTKIGLIPCARGSTTIHDWRQLASSTSLYGRCLDRMEAAQAHGTLGGILWWQGESDARDDADANPTGWAADFATLVAAWRSDLADPDLPIVFAQLGTTSNALLTEWETVKAQQASVDIEGVSMITTDDLDLIDTVHLDGPSQVIVGARFAAVMP